MSDILFSTKKGNGGLIGFITLNRVKTLNALTFEMVCAMRKQLMAWQEDEAIHAVVVQSNSEKAFCAGGDVVKLRQISEKSPENPMAFFKEEYLLNCLIRAYTKPYVCLLNGLTIGGGVGISLHGNYPIATEHFSFAMPETGIGFFPDVGGGYLLTRCKGAFGLYLGLTGKRISRADATFCGLIQYTIASDKQADFIHALLEADLSEKTNASMASLLSLFADKKPKLSGLRNDEEAVNHAFSAGSVETIFLRLEAQNTPWSQKTLLLLRAKSPTALKVTFEQLKRVAGLSMEDTMRIEFGMSAQFMKSNDFFEGVRALLIDKDGKPNWQPNQLKKVSKESVEAYFSANQGASQLF